MILWTLMTEKERHQGYKTLYSSRLQNIRPNDYESYIHYKIITLKTALFRNLNFLKYVLYIFNSLSKKEIIVKNYSNFVGYMGEIDNTWHTLGVTSSKALDTMNPLSRHHMSYLLAHGCMAIMCLSISIFYAPIDPLSLFILSIFIIYPYLHSPLCFQLYSLILFVICDQPFAQPNY